MDKEVKGALSGIKSAWKNMLTATDRDTYEFWRDEQLRLQKILYDEKKRTMQRLRKSEDKKGENRAKIQQYQHEYYLRVTKAKRAERKEQ